MHSRATKTEAVRHHKRAERRAYLETIQERRDLLDHQYDARRSLDEVRAASARVQKLRKSKSIHSIHLSSLSPVERYVLIVDELYDQMRISRYVKVTTSRSQIEEVMSLQLMFVKSKGFEVSQSWLLNHLFENQASVNRATSIATRSPDLQTLRKNLGKLCDIVKDDKFWSQRSHGHKPARDTEATEILTSASMWMDLDAESYLGPQSDGVWEILKWTSLAVSVGALAVLSGGLASPFIAGALGAIGSSIVAGGMGTAATYAITTALRVSSFFTALKSIFDNLESLRQYKMTGDRRDVKYTDAGSWMEDDLIVLTVGLIDIGRFATSYLPQKMVAKTFAAMGRGAETASVSAAMKQYNGWLNGISNGGELFDFKAYVKANEKLASRFQVIARINHYQKNVTEPLAGTIKFAALKFGKNEREYSNKDKAFLSSRAIDQHIMKFRKAFDSTWLEDRVKEAEPITNRIKELYWNEESISRPSTSVIED